jgi:putative addiction module component (TIGR02574 family)
MTDPVIELSKQAHALSSADRARLAELLLDSIHTPLGEEVDSAWGVEIKRRMDDIDHGRVALIPAEEVFAQVRRAVQ